MREMTVTTWIANNWDEDDGAERDVTSLYVDFENVKWTMSCHFTL